MGIYNKKISVIFFMDSFFPIMDGVTICMDAYARYFSKFGEAYVVAPHIKGENDGKLPYKVFRVKSFKIPFNQYYLVSSLNKAKLLYDLSKLKCNIVHIHSPFGVGKIGLKLAKQLNVPCVATFHSKFKSDFKKYTHSNLLATYMVRKIMAVFEQADAVWTVNNSTANTMRDYGFKGKINIVPNGVESFDEDLVEDRLEELKKKYPDEDQNKLLFVGRLTKQKNINLILLALSLYKNSGKKFKFFCIGYGDDEKQIKSLANKLNLEGNVVFTGAIRDRALLGAYYKFSDVFIFPSAYDTDGIVKREAAYFGTPSIVCKNTNVSEGIFHNINGYLIEPNKESLFNIINQACCDKPKNFVVGQKAKETLSRSWNSILKEDVTSMYWKLIEAKAKNLL